MSERNEHRQNALAPSAAVGAPPARRSGPGDGPLSSGLTALRRIVDDGEPIAEMRLCADTESVDRTRMTRTELYDAEVGHTFIQLRLKEGAVLPEATGEPGLSPLRELRRTSFGFWPGRRGWSERLFNSYVPGRVREPDEEHQAKGWMSYELTAGEVRALYRYVDAHREAPYSMYFYNCTTFATEAVRAAGKRAPNAHAFAAVCLPNELYTQILRRQRRGEKDAETTPLGRNRQGIEETQESADATPHRAPSVFGPRVRW